MKESNILFITDRYLPFPSSNGACVSKLVDAFPQVGNTYVLSFSKKEAECSLPNVFNCRYDRKPSSIFNRLFEYCQDDGAVNALYAAAEQIILQKNIDIVVCVYRPVECLLAGLNLKKAYPHLCVVGYFLDNIYEWSTSSKLKDGIFYLNQNRLLHKLNRKLDSLIILKYYQPTFEKMLGKSDKVAYAGLPSLQQHPQTERNEEFNETNINIVYAGSFYPKCRRPDQILTFMQAVCAKLPQIKIYLYAWGCEDMVDKAKEAMEGNLVVCGRVPSEKVAKAIQSADILLNVGNDLPYAVPGKLFEYFSTGKPVINFCYRRDDGAAADCKKYGNVFNVYADGINSVDDCVSFILNRCQLPWDALKEAFRDSLPEYTAGIILEAGRRSKNV